MPTDEQIAEMPDMAELAESCADGGLPFVESTAVKAWKMGYAYLWHRLTVEEKARFDDGRE